jgi:type I restriction enzyme M protein
VPISEEAYRWGVWAAPRKPRAGAEKAHIDHKALTGDDLTDFVNNQLFSYLKGFKQSAERADAHFLS